MNKKINDKSIDKSAIMQKSKVSDPISLGKLKLPIGDREKETSRFSSKYAIESLTKPTTAFTQALAREIVKNLVSFGELTTRPFKKTPSITEDTDTQSLTLLGDNPILVDTSVLIDGRIVPVVNSGFFSGLLVVPQFVLGEVQHIADSADLIRRSKGRRGLDVVNKLKNQKINPNVSLKIVKDDPIDVKEVDHKLIALIQRWKKTSGGKNLKLLTVDFNLAQLARVQNVKVLNINDLAQAIKIALVPGEDIQIRISHAGKEREQGVGYLTDGTMIVVDNAKDKIGLEVTVSIIKIHQTPAGQLFFAKIR